jgi:2,4-diaminopentanoate dehydrogenase
MTEKINILQLGLGPIGLKISALLAQRTRANIVAAVDIRPELQHQSLGDLLNNDHINTTITNELSTAIDTNDIDIAVVTTTSSAQSLAAQIHPLLVAKIPVVTTCEELLYPWKTQSELAKELDATAKKNNVSILATGVNPGFLMDYLPAITTSLSQNLESIIVHRVQDASQRRLPFQKKIGVGLQAHEFEDRLKHGTLKHVGLPESVYFLADVLHLQLDQVQESIEPIIADGVVQGLQQQAFGIVNEKKVITLNFVASMHHPSPEDRIIIQGDPTFEINITPGVNGDIATSAVTVNAIPSVLKANPGLHSMASIPPVHYW